MFVVGRVFIDFWWLIKYVLNRSRRDYSFSIPGFGYQLDFT